MGKKNKKTPAPVEVKKEVKPQEKKEKSKPSPHKEKEAEAVDQSKVIQQIRSLAQDRKVQIGVGVVVLLIVAGVVGALVWKNGNGADKQQANNTNTQEDGKKKKQSKDGNEEVSLTMPRGLDGIIVANDDANKVPACVMIENAAFSGVRPQSGLSAASVMYEVIVEGGITRLMAVYGGEQADPVGPVRSARDTYLEFASEYNCAYIHAGGSYTAIQALANLDMRDIDALRESKWFWRDNSKFAPHDLFTNTTNLYEAIVQGHSWTAPPAYDSWKFVDANQLPEGEAATQVNIEFGGAYNVTYDFKSKDNYYERTNGGVVHLDANTGNPLTTRNIIVQHVPAGEFIEGKGRVNFSVTGEGAVEIFRNGLLTKGTWKKENRLARTKFFAEDGTEIPLLRGNSWVEIVPEGYAVDWKN